MTAQLPVISALNELEGDLGRFGVSSGAIIHPESNTAQSVAREVYAALNALGSLNYSLGVCDLMYVEGTNHRLERIRFTGETMINTMAGKLIIPPNVKLRCTSRR